LDALGSGRGRFCGHKTTTTKMNFQQTGKLIRVFEAEHRTSSFTSREFVIEVAGQYPQFIKFQLVQDRVDIVNAHKIGDEVTVHFDLRGREWQGKYFTNLQAWKVERAGDGVDDGTTTQTHAPAKPEPATMDWSVPAEPTTAQVGTPNDSEDMPF
jgi:single-strand DNA-binding protein